MQNQSFYIVSAILAFVPAFLWLTFLFKKNKNKGLQALIFCGGIFSVIPIFLLQYFFNNFPQFDIVAIFKNTFTNSYAQYFTLYVWVGITEEIIKQWLVRTFDRKYLLIQTVNDSILFSLISALGFSFAENIFYFYYIGTQLGLATLFVAYLFRSIFTTCAHLVFSGFFGYFYGIAKFSINIFEQSTVQGKRFYLSRFFARFLNISKLEAYREQMILKGLFIAILLHTAYDFLLQFNLILPSVAIVTLGFFALLRLLKHRSGNLILVTNVAEQQTSTMAKKDEDVAIELLGMWFNQNKYVDVIHICERLLKRDPDNKIIQLFKAKALDRMDQKNPYAIILQKIFPDKNNPVIPPVQKL